MSEEMMLNGYETREEMIRDHWKRYGSPWNVKEWRRLKIPIRHNGYPYFRPHREEEGVEVPEIALEYSFERGSLDGRPAYRITCENVVVEEALL